MMEEITGKGLNEKEIVRRVYARADRFAWALMVGLAFAGFIGAQLVLHDLMVSLVLVGICIVGMISRELYLNWIFSGVPPLFEQNELKPTLRGAIIHIVFVMVIWLVPDISDGRLSAISIAGSLLSGGGISVYPWWQRNYSSVKK